MKYHDYFQMRTIGHHVQNVSTNLLVVVVTQSTQTQECLWNLVYNLEHKGGMICQLKQGCQKQNQVECVVTLPNHKFYPFKIEKGSKTL